MALISTLQRAEGQVIKTYKNNSGKFTHVIKTPISGVGTGVRVVKCDVFDNPYKITDIVGKRKEVYTKAPDGSTIQQIGDKIYNFPHIIFNSLIDRFR